ncbi:MAG TPA: tail fiber protein [Candidatus Competibacteraceae bacterium]|nr:tail fiber protein [Candidatus Competibacteraceae bacterium]
MAQPYVGEIRMFAGNFAPAGWMLCEGQLLPIAENEALFQLIGTTYGGDGESTFALPDLRGRVPIHQGSDNQGNFYTLGKSGGSETVTLTVSQIPAHSHPLLASMALATQEGPSRNVTGQSEINIYGQTPPLAQMSAVTIASNGSSQPHDNMQPFLCINFIISLFGIFPSPT